MLLADASRWQVYIKQELTVDTFRFSMYLKFSLKKLRVGVGEMTVLCGGTMRAQGTPETKGCPRPDPSCCSKRHALLLPGRLAPGGWSGV